MYKFVINSTVDRVKDKIQSDQLYRRRPPNYFSVENVECNTLIGGNARGKYWMCARVSSDKGVFGVYRYFIYRLIPDGNQTLIKGKFTYTLWFRLTTIFSILLACSLCEIRGKGFPIKERLKFYFVVVVIAFTIEIIYRLIHNFSTKYHEKLVINYFMELENEFFQPTSDE